MVAYSFKTEFAPDIQSGRKTHTIRAGRKRHARPGEALQLYCKMRHPDCFKIIPDPKCTFTDTIHILFGPESLILISIGHGDEEVLPEDFDWFARLDGFSDASAMHQFWLEQDCPEIEGTTAREFEGFLIGWGKHPLDVLYPHPNMGTLD